MKEENVIDNYVLRYRRFTDDFGDDYVGESDYKNIWEDLSENNEEESESVLLLCVFITFLSIIFLTSITTNVAILLVFARKQSLRTTSNR